MSGRQRILVVSDGADEDELFRVRDGLGRDPVVLGAPTAEAARVVRALAVEPQVETLLAPVTSPPADRGHRLDTLVRSYALHDRFRDVVVVTDRATVTLLLRALAPDQLAVGRSVTVVGLPRGDRPVAAGRAVVSGLVLGAAAAVTQPVMPVLALPVAAACLGLVLLLLPQCRHLGRELLLACAVALAALFVVVTGSSRFPGSW